MQKLNNTWPSSWCRGSLDLHAGSSCLNLPELFNSFETFPRPFMQLIIHRFDHYADIQTFLLVDNDICRLSLINADADADTVTSRSNTRKYIRLSAPSSLGRSFLSDPGIPGVRSMGPSVSN